MLKTVTSLLVLLMFISVGNLSADKIRKAELIVLDGSEPVPPTTKKSVQSNIDVRNIQYPPVQTSFGNFTFQQTGTSSFYDLQSNGTTNQVWQDPLIPANVHACYMNAPVSGGTRVCTYLLSNDMGMTWQNLGDIPAGIASGFPSVSGLPNGAAVISNHNNSNGTPTRAKVFVDLGAGIGAFTEYDPGSSTEGDPIWPRVLGASNSNVVLVASINGQEFQYTNTLALPSGVFSGYEFYNGDQAETYWVSLAANGNIGHAYLGSVGDLQGDVFYRESSDGGLTWGAPTTLFNANVVADSLGCLRGVSMVFLGNTPCVTFSIDYLTETGYFPGLPSKILFWSPDVNSGNLLTVADSNNVPFHPNGGVNPGVFTPICRPAIGKAHDDSHLFVGFNVAGPDTNDVGDVYYQIWGTVSENGGADWKAPERITPTTPVTDWRYVSVSQTNNRVGDDVVYQMTVSNDPVAGTFAPTPPSSPGTMIGIRGEYTVGINNISNVVPSKFSLHQNFPNPFNPSTSIRFDITKSTNVTLKVYDVNGREIATLANNEAVTPGTKEVRFDASNYSTGIYFYTLYAGDFKETKKMMLIK